MSHILEEVNYMARDNCKQWAGKLAVFFEISQFGTKSSFTFLLIHNLLSVSTMSTIEIDNCLDPTD